MSHFTNPPISPKPRVCLSCRTNGPYCSGNRASTSIIPSDRPPYGQSHAYYRPHHRSDRQAAGRATMSLVDADHHGRRDSRQPLGYVCNPAGPRLKELRISFRGRDPYSCVLDRRSTNPHTIARSFDDRSCRPQSIFELPLKFQERVI